MRKDFDPAENIATIVELLQWRALSHPDKIALTFLQDGESEEISLTYGELDQRARAIAVMLQHLEADGERALLLYPAGLDFIAALCGCFYAKVIAVPAYPPHFNRPMPRLQAISASSQATLVLTTTQILANAEKRLNNAPELKKLRWRATDSLNTETAKEWRDPGADSETLAFLQYTSGSTNLPKGVMVTHGNLLYNERMVKRAYEHTEQSTFVGWLPLYHDMGLIGNVFQPLYIGALSVLMAPTAFLQKPFRWLQAISHYGAHTSGAPNFAYDLCTQRVLPEQRELLDLSHWSVAFNGAEPLHPETLQRFATFFESCGFRREAFYPCYGLAEATLFVSGGLKSELPLVQTLQNAALEQHQVVESDDSGYESRTLVSSGRTWLDQQIAIVNPESLARCTSSEVGEIWLSGPNIARGYWGQPELTEETFGAYIRDTGEGPFLRTGDLGFLRDGELFVTGRLKDLIIIRGRNHYPQDIEWVTEQSHLSLRAGSSAAFSVEVNQQERLVIVAEVRRQFQQADVEEIFDAIRHRVAEQHELEVYAITLLRTGSIPKTTSGKIQRHACRAAFLAGNLNAIGEWVQKITGSAHVEDADEAESLSKDATLSSLPLQAIQGWLVSRLAARLCVESHLIDVRRPFTSYGLDSVAAVDLIADLGAWLGRQLPATLVYEHPTISALARHLASETFHLNSEAREETPLATREPLAIIGIGCRFPGASGPEAFWKLLRDGVDAITEVPGNRWEARAFYSSDHATPGKMNTRWGGFLDQVDYFDASFFGISPREATQMDPQQRLLLEVAWEALEDAGQVPGQLAGSRTGVFVGLTGSEYAALQLNDPTLVDAYATTGGALSIAANRLSYFFDFRGPSLSVDTACSSSLVAVHLACQSLWSGESSLALAGGANLILSPSVTIGFSQAGAMSPDGRCKAFDAGANGIVRSEGVGIVVLKPLSRARADGDPIYAVIRGSAVTQDGKSNGITAPSAAAQEAALRDAYRVAGVSPGQVQYVETHGTGTLLGDPIEASALGRVLGAERPTHSQPCAIGSVKTNIGHTEAAAGIASLIKVALSIKHREIPPSLHFQSPNQHIPFESLGLRVQQSLGGWPEQSEPALAGVSAFGFGGTNAHVVVQEVTRNVPTVELSEDRADDRPFLLPLSAHTPEALRALAQAYRELLASIENPAASALRNICSTASVRREHHDHRVAIIARNMEEMIERLDAFLRGETRAEMPIGRVVPSQPRKIVFVFSGYGGQWWAMGRDLLKRDPVFRAMIAQCDELLRQYHVEWTLMDELLADEAQSRLDGSNVEITQIALFALQVSLTAVWRSWGVQPDAVVGHSLGEVAAAQAAGILSLPDAVRVIFHRSRLMQQSLQHADAQGAMAAVDLSMEDARQVLTGYEDRLSVAVHNAPGAIVLAGEAEALEQILQTLRRRGIEGKVLLAPGAGHSPQVEIVKSQLSEALEGLRPEPATVPIFSTVTGGPLEGQMFDVAYWGRNVREPVLFAEAIERLGAEGYNVFLELSPMPILSPAIIQSLSRRYEATVLPSLRRRKEDRAVMLRALANLYAHGYNVDWRSYYGDRVEHVQLPSYPWQRERYWIDDRRMKIGRGWRKLSNGRKDEASGHPLLGHHIESAMHDGAHFWEMSLCVGMVPYLERIRGRAFLPSTAYMEMALAAAGEAFGVAPHALEDINFHEALILPDGVDQTRTIQLVISGKSSGAASFQFFSLSSEATHQPASWTLHAQGKIRLATNGIHHARENRSVRST